MHLANSYYGHSDVLGAYAGRPRPRPPIFGMVQHGWNRRTGFSPNDPPAPLRSMLPAFVWNGQNLERAQNAGYRNVTAIGAPFLYLVRSEEEDVQTVDASERTSIVYPFHTWELATTAGGSHDEFAAEVVEREPPGSTVCLYWLEYDDDEVRSAYESRGLRVICHGNRFDRDFLYRQLAELRRHRRLVTNRVGTALWYGAFLGMEVEIYGPKMGTEESLEGREKAYAAAVSCWPELFDGPVGPAQAREIGKEELGARFLRSPMELRELLGWHGWRRALADLSAPVTRSLMHLKMRMEGW